ncbi:MAG: hypothetical protein KC501_06460 [Myxococcales bacterium]|nr:hypothetical protein [Myxococcales bacterium]
MIQHGIRTSPIAAALRRVAVAAATLRRAGVATAPGLMLALATLLLPRVAAASPEDRVEWGLHRVELERSTVVVRSRLAVAGHLDEPIPLAAPLPEDAELHGAEAQRAADGSVVGLRLVSDGSDATVETRVPWDEVRRRGALPVPVPKGRSVHRVVLDPALSFSPDPELGLVAQVGHYAPAEFDVVHRHRFDARTDGELGHVGAYYLRGSDLGTTGALHGEVALKRQRMGRAALVAGGLFGLVVLGMAIAHRRLSRHVRYERAEAFLEQELRALEDDDASVLRPPAPRQV